ncbi:MAG TPA: zf-HC2 domain-containing protein [Candidatus Krumholzibacteria bacterium]
MQCEKAIDLIQSYLEGRLATLERNEFVHHVTECAACEREVLAYRELFQGLRELSLVEAPERLSVGVLAALRAEGVIHDQPLPARVTDRFLSLPGRIRYPLAALIVIVFLYIPVALVLGNAGSSIAGAAESLARGVVWARSLATDFPGVAGVDTYVRAARTILHAAGAVVSPLTWLAVIGVIAAALFSMSRVLRRKRQSDHAVFNF